MIATANRPVCTDDFGTEVYRCHFSNELTWADSCLISGSIIPGARVKYVQSPTQTGIQARRDSVRDFDRSDANCNTCSHLRRVKHDKTPCGFLFGECKNDRADFDSHPYKSSIKNRVVKFHPADWMGMPCYQARGEK